MVQTPIEQIRQRSKPSQRCGAGRAINHPDHGDAIKEALKDKDCTLVAISDYLKGQGQNISPDTLSKHRRGGCACPKH